MQDFQAFLAPAKINLFLHIVGQRSDGYHLLQTVFRLLDHYDTIYLKPTDSKHIRRVNDVPGVPEDNDLCIRAAKLLQQHTGCGRGVEILVEKNIPMGGGLGGGSSMDTAKGCLTQNVVRSQTPPHVRKWRKSMFSEPGQRVLHPVSTSEPPRASLCTSGPRPTREGTIC
mgnify:CR=1 FL=1